MKKNILFLDDSAFMRQTIGDLLKSLNYGVETFPDARDALERVKSTRFDMIITDMHMPDLDGAKFAQEVRTFPGCRFLPIVMLSSEKDNEKIAEAKRMGVSTFLPKPLNETQLTTMLEITLNQRMTPRVPLKLDAVLKTPGASSSGKNTYTINVSEGGVFVETDSPLSPGRTVEIAISLPEDHRPLNCHSQVVWNISSPAPGNNEHPPGMGLEFLKIDDDQRLRRFLQS